MKNNISSIAILAKIRRRFLSADTILWTHVAHTDSKHR